MLQFWGASFLTVPIFFGSLNTQAFQNNFGNKNSGCYYSELTYSVWNKSVFTSEKKTFLQVLCYLKKKHLEILKKFKICFLFLHLQGMITQSLTKLYDGLVDNMRTLLSLRIVCPKKALANISTGNNFKMSLLLNTISSWGWWSNYCICDYFWTCLGNIQLLTWRVSQKITKPLTRRWNWGVTNRSRITLPKDWKSSVSKLFQANNCQKCNHIIIII